MAVKARSRANGEIYTLRDEHYERYKKDWELIEEPEDKEYTYQELKDKLEELGVGFKKNASKKTLQKLLDLEGEVI